MSVVSTEFLDCNGHVFASVPGEGNIFSHKDPDSLRGDIPNDGGPFSKIITHSDGKVEHVSSPNWLYGTWNTIW